jgi:hypothetical protein
MPVDVNIIGVDSSRSQMDRSAAHGLKDSNVAKPLVSSTYISSSEVYVLNIGRPILAEPCRSWAAKPVSDRLSWSCSPPEKERRAVILCKVGLID